MRTAPIVGMIAATCFLQIANAEEIRLRCDPLGKQSDTAIITIDTERRSVLVRWANKSEEFIDNKSVPAPKDDDRTPCIFAAHQYVNILSERIIFGSITTNVNECGNVSPLSAP